MIAPDVWYTIFPRLLNMSITASVVIVFVVIARFFLRKAPRIFSYVLWSVVLFRLVCPFSFTTPFSLLRLTSPKSVESKTVVYIPEDIVHMEEPEVSLPVPVVGVTLSESINKALPKGSEQTGADPLELTVSVMTYVWIVGVLVMAGYSIVSVIKMKKRLVGAVKLKDNIWIADHVHTSFVMGIFRPRIYLWSGLSQKEQEFVIMHEKIHIKRCDHLVKIFFWLVLTLHWFNPLVWLSYILCMQDMEMSCDESVMRNMKEDVRADYSESLLSLATGKKIFAGSLLFFGEGDIKSRIKNVLNYKKPTVWVIAAGIVIVAVLGICFMGNPAVDSDNLENSISKEEREEEWKKYLEQKVAEDLKEYEFISDAKVTITEGNGKNIVNVRVVLEKEDTLNEEQRTELINYVKMAVPDVNEKTILINVAEVNDWVYPQYPVYVRTIGNASIGCEYGYCAKEDRNDADILEDLSRMNGFYFSNNYSEDVALFYSEEPQEIKLYHAMEGNGNYEEYAFAGEDYEYPYGAEKEKYVIRVPEEYGMHYFVAVISWEDGSEDLLYFSMENKYNPPSDADYNQIQITENETGTYFTE
ncbi:MAG: M56 family metallopeptidase [Thermoflexaceae bacterium]|nr:M56 family metallopeptidase [Thermoflexaceae bacterium]